MFDKNLIAACKLYFYDVFPCNGCIYIYRTKWEYESPVVAQNNDELKSIVDEQEQFIIEGFEGIYSKEELIERGILYKI